MTDDALQADPTSYSYLFVLKSLTHPQRIVQAAHAAIELGRRLPASSDHPHLVLVGLELADLHRLLVQLEKRGVEFSAFYEPDFDNTLTAVATLPQVGLARKWLQRYQLLTEENSV